MTDENRTALDDGGIFPGYDGPPTPWAELTPYIKCDHDHVMVASKMDDGQIAVVMGPFSAEGRLTDICAILAMPLARFQTTAECWVGWAAMQ